MVILLSADLDRFQRGCKCPTLAKPPASAEESGGCRVVAAAVCVDALCPQVPHLHFLLLRGHWLVPCIQGSKRIHSEVVLGSLQRIISLRPRI